MPVFPEEQEAEVYGQAPQSIVDSEIRGWGAYGTDG